MGKTGDFYLNGKRTVVSAQQCPAIGPLGQREKTRNNAIKYIICKKKDIGYKLDPPLSPSSVWTVDDVINGLGIEIDPPLFSTLRYKCAQNGAIKLEIYQNQKRK